MFPRYLIILISFRTAIVYQGSTGCKTHCSELDVFMAAFLIAILREALHNNPDMRLLFSLSSRLKHEKNLSGLFVLTCLNMISLVCSH